VSDALLQIRDLSVTFGTQKALDAVSLSVAPNLAFGLIGPNGAGKSTLIDAVTGYLPAARGEVTFAGESIGGMAPDRRARRGMARTFQTLELFEDLTVRENLLVAAQQRRWFQRFADLVRPARDAAPERTVRDVLELLEISELADRVPLELSHGHRNLISVARALAASPRLVLLDEPAAGLDQEESEQLGRRLRRLVDSGVTVLLIDHDMSLVLSVCDRIHVLDFGRTIGEGTPAEIRESPAVVDAYLGVPAGAEDDGGDR
jgi:branched-chain amino acid transport system ATP-binding protein